MAVGCAAPTTVDRVADIGRWNGLIAESDRIADDVLWPRAQEVDQASSIPVEHLRTLADAGLHGLAAPAELGGLGAPPVVQRAVMRRLARGCGATAFCFAQHHGVVTAGAGSTRG